VSEDPAHGLIAEIGLDPDRDDWEVARDEAVLTLLWGCGLRISEALSLARRDAPLGESLRITGKGGKTRITPVLDIVRERIDSYVVALPFALAPDEPLFRAKRGGPLSPRHVQATMQVLRGRLGLFSDKLDQVQSMAIVRLALWEPSRQGLLAFGSADPLGFTPDMGTELVSFLARVVERTAERWPIL
jgi:hypothetical protein